MSSGALAGTKGVPRAEREQQIVAHAVDEFAANGYAGASMVRIARRAGISKPLIYQYFGSKDGLFLTCLHEVAGGLLARLDEAELSVDDTVASRVFALQAVFEALEPQRDAWKLLYDVTMPSDGPDRGGGTGLPQPHRRPGRERLGALPACARGGQRVGRLGAQPRYGWDWSTRWCSGGWITRRNPRRTWCSAAPG